MEQKCPWTAYPRPQLQRESGLNLNGIWEFALIKEGDSAPDAYPDRILVPFCPESKLSGLHFPILPRQIMYYRRTVMIAQEFLSDRTFLHFGAVDQRCEIFLNGQSVGAHAGGYLPFSIDITKAVHVGENEIVVRATDPLDHDLPWGKQKYRRGGMWYTPVSGIWQTVWMESISFDAVTAISMQPSLDTLVLHVETEADSFLLSIPEIGYHARHTEKSLRIPIPDPKRWTPDVPHLYRFSIRTEHDCVHSYFALRTVETAKSKDGYWRILLNGEPIFLHGILDQGYYEDGIYTPKSPECYETDILRMKQMGFNLLRKHIKVEPLYFYHLCDKLGMLVMQDFVSTGEYSFLRDTALPTIGLTALPDSMLPRSKRAKAYFLQNAVGTQELLKNSPSVIAYTIFNEGWGQFSADRVYAYLKKRDPSRLYDATSGWFTQKKSDLDSRHIYFRKLKMKAGDKPLFLSEFGGYAYRDPAHAFSSDVYGYRTMKSAKELEDAIIALYEEQVIPLIREGLCGTVYTQLSDVEDETNGLITYDREVVKVDPKRMNSMAEKLKKAIKADS